MYATQSCHYFDLVAMMCILEGYRCTIPLNCQSDSRAVQISAWRSTTEIQRLKSTYPTVNARVSPARLDTCRSTLILAVSNLGEMT